MQVHLNLHDQEVAQQVSALQPLCDALAKRHEHDLCRLSLTSGVVIADVYAKDGMCGRVVMGVRALALILCSPEKIPPLVNQIIRWASRKQADARLTRGLGISIVNWQN